MEFFQRSEGYSVYLLVVFSFVFEISATSREFKRNIFEKGLFKQRINIYLRARTRIILSQIVSLYYYASLFRYRSLNESNISFHSLFFRRSFPERFPHSRFILFSLVFAKTNRRDSPSFYRDGNIKRTLSPAEGIVRKICRAKNRGKTVASKKSRGQKGILISDF